MHYFFPTITEQFFFSFKEHTANISGGGWEAGTEKMGARGGGGGGGDGGQEVISN